MKTLAILSLLAVTPAAFAWGETGHMVIAQIAYDGLSPAVRAEADRLLQIDKTDRAYDFITTGPWADDVRRDRAETGPWHYKDIFFRQDGQSVRNHTEEPNAVTQIVRFTEVLQNRSRPEAERAEALRFIIHFVGDIHQPLHATSRETAALPKGDRGGNDFKIVPPPWMGEHGPTNLHSLWDGGVGFFDRINRPLDTEGRSAIRMLARSLEAGFPSERLGRQAGQRNPDRWAQESFDIARRFVYTAPENGTPSGRYFREGQRIVAERVALAGYRLADLLNRALQK
ncbi:S1/P1 nuclease [soil metagenome]